MSRRNRGYGWWTFGWLEAQRKTKTRQQTKATETKIQTWTWIILGTIGLLILLETLFGITK